MLSEINSSNGSEKYSLEPEIGNVENTIKVIVSSISILGDLFVLLTVMAFIPLRQQLSSLVFANAFFQMIFHSLLIFSTITKSIPCQIAGALIQFLLLAQECYFFMLCFNLYYSTKYPFDMSRWMPSLYHLFVLKLSGLTAYIFYVSSQSNPSNNSSSRRRIEDQDHYFCWYDEKNTVKRDLLTFLLFFLPVCTGYVVSLTCYGSALRRVRRIAILQSPDRCEQLEKMRLVIIWSFSYWIVVAIPFTICATGLVGFNTPIENWLRFIMRLLLACKGTYSGIVWYFGAEIKSVYVLWKERNWDEYMKVVDPNWVLRRQILHFAIQGIQKAACTASSSSLNNHTTMLVVDDNKIKEKSKKNSRTSQQQQEAEENFGDLCHFPPTSSSPSQPNISTIQLHDAHSNQKVCFLDYEAISFHQIRQLCGFSTENFICSFQGGKTSSLRERFSDGKSGSFFYYTGDQRFILKTCTKQEITYLLEILPKYIDYLQKNPKSLLCRFVGCHELIIEEKKVSFIVLSNVIATNDHHANTNREGNNDKSHNDDDGDVVCVVDSFYDLKGSWVGRYQKDPQQGSRHVCKYCGLDFIVGWSKEKCRQNPFCNKGHEAHVIGKDLNWAFRKLELEKNIAKQMAKQLEMDSEFLRSIHSMDYSLVIGLHHTHEQQQQQQMKGMKLPHPHHHQEQERDLNNFPFELFNTPRRQQQQQKRKSDVQNTSHTPYTNKTESLFHSNNRTDTSAFDCDSCIIYMGIIDILTPFCLRKRLEHFLRTFFLLQNGKGISCVDPTTYAERFRRNVIDVVIRGKQVPTALMRRIGDR
jgi:1-phosphatidylinositol-4-phosphate 5-kinase